MIRLYSIAIEIVTWAVLVPIELARIALGHSSIDALRERLGSIPRSAPTAKKRLLVHAVSAGEMHAASALVHEMARRGWRIALSAGNEDAHVMAGRIAAFHSEVERVLRLPWDRPAAMRRFLSALQPGVVVVMETELWPGLFGACRELGLPLFIAGARIERGPASRYRLARPFFTRLLEACSAILTVDQEAADRFIAIGAPPERVMIAGELKAEACLAGHGPPPSDLHAGLVIVAGSTHPGEEEIILAAYERVCEDVPGVRLILVPRHVRRARSIRALAHEAGITVIDRMGELPSLHRIADVVITGGTFVPIGGHDLFDPARAGRAIVIGPHVDNIRGIATAMREADAICMTSAQELADVLIQLLNDERRRHSLGDNARKYSEARQGASSITADRIEVAVVQTSNSKLQNQAGPLARLIRHWETLHPYNFVDVLELSAPVDRKRLADAAGDTLEEMLGIRVVVPMQSGIDVVHELARRFEDTEAPVRIGWQSPSRVGFTFRHACFDGIGAAIFVKRAVGRALNESLESLAISASRERVVIRHIPHSVRDLLTMRHVASRSGIRGDSPLNRVRFVDHDRTLLDRLHTEAAAHEATINDVLAARLATAMRRVGPLVKGSRDGTSIAIAVGMRREHEPFSRDVAVGWFPVFAYADAPLDSIREQTTREKRTGAWIRSRTEMRAASLLWPWIAPASRDRYLARQYVLTAGLTTLRVDDAGWIASYRRAVATGPVAPLVVTALTTGERLFLAITWRAARFRDEEIDVIANALVV